MGAQGGIHRRPHRKKNQRPPSFLFLGLEAAATSPRFSRRDEDIRGHRGRRLLALGGCRGRLRALAALGRQPPAVGAVPRCHLTRCAAQYCNWTFQRGPVTCVLVSRRSKCPPCPLDADGRHLTGADFAGFQPGNESTDRTARCHSTVNHMASNYGDTELPILVSRPL